MLEINCPYCGLRDQTEFAYFGQAHIVRPVEPDILSDQEWADYVFYRDNTYGDHCERWYHAHGCRRFFNLQRRTDNGVIIRSYEVVQS